MINFHNLTRFFIIYKYIIIAQNSGEEPFNQGVPRSNRGWITKLPKKALET